MRKFFGVAGVIACIIACGSSCVVEATHEEHEQKVGNLLTLTSLKPTSSVPAAPRVLVKNTNGSNSSSKVVVSNASIVSQVVPITVSRAESGAPTPLFYDSPGASEVASLHTPASTTDSVSSTQSVVSPCQLPVPTQFNAPHSVSSEQGVLSPSCYQSITSPFTLVSPSATSPSESVQSLHTSNGLSTRLSTGSSIPMHPPTNSFLRQNGNNGRESYVDIKIAELSNWVRYEITEIKGEISNVKEEITDIKEGMEGMKEKMEKDITDLKKDMSDLKKDMSNLKKDMSNLRNNIAKDMTDLRNDIAKDMTDLKKDMADLKNMFIEALSALKPTEFPPQPFKKK
jgi:uncharacterized membrane-anchored protein YhcB (DUF1043 family)